MRILVEEDELPLIGIPITEAHRALREGTFPLPSSNVRSGRLTWWRSELDDWVASQATAPRYYARC